MPEEYQIEKLPSKHHIRTLTTATRKARQRLRFILGLKPKDLLTSWKVEKALIMAIDNDPWCRSRGVKTITDLREVL